MRKKGWLILVLFGFLVLDTVYTFLQHHQVALDGDLSSLVLPSPYYEPVLASPFGWEAITGEESYASPNRFFVHWSMYHYFRIGPRWLGALTDTVEGIYLSSAIAKTGAHLLLLVLLSWLAGREGSARDWLWAAVLLAPLFQSAGFYQPVIGLIEPSPSYTFFADITAVDEPSCERKAMQQLATAGQDTILLAPDCPILTWRQVPNQDTRPPSELLVLWGILEEGQQFIYERE